MRRGLGFGFGVRQRRKKQARQDRNDGDDDKKFDKGEGAAVLEPSQQRNGARRCSNMFVHGLCPGSYM